MTSELSDSDCCTMLAKVGRRHKLYGLSWHQAKLNVAIVVESFDGPWDSYLALRCDCVHVGEVYDDKVTNIRESWITITSHLNFYIKYELLISFYGKFTPYMCVWAVFLINVLNVLIK